VEEASAAGAGEAAGAAAETAEPGG
jgi:hypothetical protein